MRIDWDRGAPVVALLLLVALAYGNILGNRFTNWDDNHLIVRNKAIRTVDPVFVLRNFHLSYPPLTPLSHSMDYFFWRLNPVGYHFTDLLLYALVVMAFFLLCGRLLGDRGGALAAAALFTVHPLHVESVTWLSSRKDGLGMLFYMLAFLAYLRKGDGSPSLCPPLQAGEGMLKVSIMSGKSSSGEGGTGFLWLSAVFYLCALWAKPLMITLPLALILYDATIGRRQDRPLRVRGILLNKLPYLFPLALTALAAVFLDPHNEMRAPYHGGRPYATFLAITTVLGDYLRMLVLPVGLSPLYVVRIPAGLLEVRCLLPIAAVLALAALAIRKRRERPLLSFCIAWAGVSLLPVLQIVPVNVVKADRYLYLPTAALCLLCGGAIVSRALLRRRKECAAAVVALVALFAVLTAAQNSIWRDSTSLWEVVIMRDPVNADAYNNLGIACAEGGDYGSAEAILKHALTLRPDYPSARNNLANVYRVTGRYEEALEELRKAMGLTKDVVYAASVYMNMGLVYEARGQYREALEAFERATWISPVYLDDSALREHMEGCRRLAGQQPGAPVSPPPR